MKKLLLLSMVISFGFFSCKTATEDEPDPNVAPTITKAPDTYTQKALLEFTTCAGCQYCPNGDIYAANLIAKYPNKVYAVALHNLQQGPDNMSSTESVAFYTSFGNGNPSGFVNRRTPKCDAYTGWDNSATGILAETAKCGVAIDATSKTGSKYKAKIYAGIGTADLPVGSYSVIAYLVNESMSGSGSGWDQVNAFNTVSGHAYFGKGNPVKGFIHENVFVKSLNTMAGTLIASDKIKAKALSTYTFDVDATGMDEDKLEVVAFIYLKSIAGNNVMNVQRVKLGKFQNFD
jgi:hypothetical protein